MAAFSDWENQWNSESDASGITPGWWYKMTAYVNCLMAPACVFCEAAESVNLCSFLRGRRLRCSRHRSATDYYDRRLGRSRTMGELRDCTRELDEDCIRSSQSLGGIGQKQYFWKLCTGYFVAVFGCVMLRAVISLHWLLTFGSN